MLDPERIRPYLWGVKTTIVMEMIEKEFRQVDEQGWGQ